jgi:ATP-binding cassette subfamily F protein 3
LSNLSLRIDNDDRIALLGANGNGKSTLVKLIAGRLEPLAGALTRASRIKIAYFAQHQLEELESGGSVYDHVRAMMPDAEVAKVRAVAGAIGFSGQSADTQIDKLSGGEKARLLLALATFGGPHLLILDEPTNHLDIDSRAALIEAINDYPGAAIIVSHDRHLLDACADRLWYVSGGTVEAFDGDLDDYRRRVLSDRFDDGRTDRRPRGSQAGPSAESRRAAVGRRAETALLRKRLTLAETEIDRLTREINRLDAALAVGNLFASDPARATELAKARASNAAALALAEEEWLAAGAALQSATG